MAKLNRGLGLAQRGVRLSLLFPHREAPAELAGFAWFCKHRPSAMHAFPCEHANRISFAQKLLDLEVGGHGKQRRLGIGECLFHIEHLQSGRANTCELSRGHHIANMLRYYLNAYIFLNIDICACALLFLGLDRQHYVSCLGSEARDRRETSSADGNVYWTQAQSPAPGFRSELRSLFPRFPGDCANPPVFG